MKISTATHQIAEVFAVLKPDLGVQPVKVTPSLYEDLDRDFHGFQQHVLISVHEFASDWSTWERHPAGDEVVMLLSGKGALVLRTDSGDKTLELAEPGAYVVVPRGIWHTARVSELTRMLFITPGENTANSERPEAGV